MTIGWRENDSWKNINYEFPRVDRMGITNDIRFIVFFKNYYYYYHIL